ADGGRTKGDTQTSRHVGAKFGVGVSGEDHQAAVGHFCYSECRKKRRANIRRVKTTRADPWSARRYVAGEEGFEPSNAGIKIRCLDQLGDSPKTFFACDADRSTKRALL